MYHHLEDWTSFYTYLHSSSACPFLHEHMDYVTRPSGQLNINLDRTNNARQSREHRNR